MNKVTEERDPQNARISGENDRTVDNPDRAVQRRWLIAEILSRETVPENSESRLSWNWVVFEDDLKSSFSVLRLI